MGDLWDMSWAESYRKHLTLIAFILLIMIGGSNAVAVRFSNLELPPFWGAAIRFVAAALIFWLITLIRRVDLPRGRSFIGAVLYGILGTGLAYAFLYWGLIEVPASLTMIILAFVPLLTLLFAVVHGLERFLWKSLAGALIAILGIIISAFSGLGASVPIASILAVLAGGICIAESSVVYKLFPASSPVSTNAIAFTTGSAILLLISLITGEQWTLPASQETWLSFLYLVLLGSVVLFYLYLYVLVRWDASVTAYSFLLFPVATAIIASVIAGEAITIAFIIGGLIVMAGVWLGAIREESAATATSDESNRSDSTLASAPPESDLPAGSAD